LPITLIAEEEAPTNITEFDITGLDINTHKFYLIVITFKNPLGVGTEYRLYFEGDFVDTNYYTQHLGASGGSVSAVRNNFPDMGYLAAGERGFHVVYVIRDVDGYPRANVRFNKRIDTVLITEKSLVHKISQANITRITFRAVESGGIGAGSKIQIYGYTS